MKFRPLFLFFVEKCQDDVRYKSVCKSYADNGYCEIYHTVLKRLCPRSCRMCGKKIVNGCYNKMADSYCKQLGLYGYCKAASFKKGMAKVCGLTCEACINNVPKLSDITPDCAKEGCCWDRKTTLSKGCPREFIYDIKSVLHAVKPEVEDFSLEGG